ncbi:MAG: transcriptional repressor NrdR [Pyramidobacter sp.]|nr:transcriptional repressor NrdR [Pyramidobacter sp.]
MRCPQCGSMDSRVMETRTADEGRSIRRRRECAACGFRFTTYERIEEQKVLWISKKDGRRETFDRSKLIRGISRACERLPVSLDTIEDMAGRIEARLRESGDEVASAEIGELVMKELAEVNKVAYVRFASVYREFTDISSFEQEIARLISRAADEIGPAESGKPEKGK